LVRLSTADATFECGVCKHAWKKRPYIACACGTERDLSGPQLWLNMLKDGKSGWTTCVDCGRFLNVDETRYRAVDVPPR
jgi:uncharacterized Zn-finger protein